MDFIKYQQSVKFLESLLNLPIKDYLLDRTDRSFYIERLNWLLQNLGNPHKGFIFIHIAGTSGKGTTVNSIHEILSSAGKKTGSYFSPHPTTAIERIKVGDKYISADEFSKLTDFLKPSLKTSLTDSPYGHPSYFETFLALAFLYFKQKKCEYVILEAGLGGTHDATNIITKPIITAITNINYDHQNILGKSLQKIAEDKAGIIKQGSTFFTTEAKSTILNTLSQKCQAKKVPFTKINGQNEPNQRLAIAISEKLKIESRYIKKGLNQAKLPCRFEIIQSKPLIIIDGSHNPSKLKFLKNKINKLQYNKLNIILGLSADKDIINSLKQIVPLADKLFLTRFLMPYRKSADLKKLSDTSIKINKKIKPIIFIDPWQALTYGLKQTKKNDCLLITGSFFLAGEIRKHWVTERQILKKRNSN